MTKNINKSPYTQETLEKLGIFAECFREWFPVFLHNRSVKSIHVYDFFAGSGTDSDGEHGSPLLLLHEARGENNSHCDQAKKSRKTVVFHFNEKLKGKSRELSGNIDAYLKECVKTCNGHCPFSFEQTQAEFKEIFETGAFRRILNDPSFAKFILLDQYGFKQVEEEVFQILVNAPKTDFVFFISSSQIKRFKNHLATKLYFDTQRIPFDEARPRDCHRQIADYYQSLVPRGKAYYLHNFTIQKGGNYWGLIFGSNHTLGMEKFLKVCWSKDPYAGESNFNIDDDWEPGTLFSQSEQSQKVKRVKDELRTGIRNKEIKTNIDGLKSALQKRCMPKLFIEVVKEMEGENLISVSCEDGSKPRYAATNIHKVEEFQIHLK